MNKALWSMINELDAEGLSIRAIASRAGVHRHTVRKALKMKHPPARSGMRRAGVIAPYRGWLMAKLQQYPELSARRLLDILREQGYPGGYSTVKECVAELRPALKPAYMTLSFAPGECAQTDTGEYGGRSTSRAAEGGCPFSPWFCVTAGCCTSSSFSARVWNAGCRRTGMPSNTSEAFPNG